MVQDGRDPLTGEQRSRRSFSELPTRRRGLRDRDTGERTALFNAALGAIPGFIMGVPFGLFLVMKYGAPAWVGIVTPFVMAAGVGGLAVLITLKAGSAGAVLYNPSGRTTPRKREYSYAESLVARGAYEEAVTAFELAIAEQRDDPTPYLRIARVLRDSMAEPERAAHWFRRALRESALERGRAVLVRKELIELYVHRLAQPSRAAPELARMAEELSGTPEGEWAARQLAEVKMRVAEGSTPD